MFNKIFVSAIASYQKYLSPFFIPHCRFRPTCSEYARLAIIKYGVLKGTGLFLLRLGKCHPLHRGGYDPVS